MRTNQGAQCHRVFEILRKLELPLPSRNGLGYICIYRLTHICDFEALPDKTIYISSNTYEVMDRPMHLYFTSENESKRSCQFTDEGS